eukprot:g9738.t1
MDCLLLELQEILEQLDAFARRVDEQFDEANTCLDQLKEEDARLDAEDRLCSPQSLTLTCQMALATKSDHGAQLEGQLEELRRLEEEKVSVSTWQSEGDAMLGSITKDVERLKQDLTQEISDLNSRFKGECDSTADRFRSEVSERQANDQELNRPGSAPVNLLFHAACCAGYCRKLHSASMLSCASWKKRPRLASEQEVMPCRIQTSSCRSPSILRSQSFPTRRTSTLTNSSTLVDELTGKCEATFQSIAERLEAIAQEERDRLSLLNQELTENLIKARADLYANIERVRSDYEQDAARLDSDLFSAHPMRVCDQREWTERCLAESSTATRAAALDSQEGLAATTKMLHALRDDAVSFREKMAKYISILQHSSDQQGEAINSLEINRTRMRAELDALVADHKAYTTDMDDWADDVRVKVERLFRALEPTKVEWRIEKATQKAKAPQFIQLL